MLLREDDRGVLAIGQPSHAWISAQLARAWGNAAFGDVHPYEEVCLAAEQHDIGMAGWDLEPSLNPQTQLPHSFIQMPLGVHIGLWGAAARRLLRQSRYAALLTSMHGVRLYEMRDVEKMADDDAAAVRGYFAEQRALQAELRASLQADPATAAIADHAVIQRGSDLIWSWDYLSLGLCLDWAPCTAKGVPLADGTPTEVTLTPVLAATGRRPSAPVSARVGRHAAAPVSARVGRHAAAPVSARVGIEPWPFAENEEAVRVHCEGQRLGTARYANENELRAGLAAAPWETLTIELVRDRSA